MAKIMTDKHELIDKLREVQKEKNISYRKLHHQIEQNGDIPPSVSTLSRLLKVGSKEYNFKYEETIRPIAKILLDIETIEETDDTDTQAIKALLKFKIQKIQDLERENSSMKVKYHERLDKERAQARLSIDFLKEQIALKDQQIKDLSDSIKVKDEQIKELLNEVIHCSRRKECL